MEDSSARFDKINSTTVSFYKTGETKSRPFVNIPLRSSAFINFENDDKYCFLWSVLAYLHPCKNKYPIRVSKYRQFFNELSIEGFDFTIGFSCSDVHKCDKLNNLSINIFELNFYKKQCKWRHKLIPTEVSKNDSYNVIDLILYKTHYALYEELKVVIGDHHKIFICRPCLNSITNENMLTLHKSKCENFDITLIRTSSESHLYWKKHFYKKPSYFRIYADFEADNETDNSSICNKTTNIYKQNPVLNGYHTESELENVLKTDYCEYLLGYDNVDWFGIEVKKLGNKMAFYFKNTKNDIIMTEENEEDNICRFYTKKH